jgi:Flp pilus assembly protein TadG
MIPVIALAEDRNGASAIVIAVSMTVLMGFAGLAVDVGFWYRDARVAQGAADSAAYSGAIDAAAGDSASGVTSTAKAIAAQYGFVDGQGHVTVTVHQPPASGPNTSTTGAVEVIVQQSETQFFSGLFMSSPGISARAVGIPAAPAKFCVLALNNGAATTNGAADVNISNGVTIDTSHCGIQVNASGADALYITGGAHLLAQTLSIVGNYATSNGGSVTVSGVLSTSAPAGLDPYAAVTMPTAGTCAANNSYSIGTYTLSPGTYCNGLSFSNGTHATLSAGVYVISGGSFSVVGGSTVTGTGVTIVLTGSGSNFASAQISNGTTVNLTAPTTGATQGIAIFQDRQSAISAADGLSGGTSFNITGAVYLPSQSVTYSNGSSNGSTCTQLIAWQIVFNGGATFNSTCAGTGVSGIGAQSTMVVE